MEQSQGGALPAERIRYRLTPLQRILPTLPLAAIGVFVLIVDTFTWASEEGYTPDTPLISAWIVLPFVALLTGRYFGVTLTQSAAVVHSLRRRTIQWSDVQAIRVEPFQLTRTVVIYEAGGRRTRLRAPVTGFLNWDRGFEEKFHTIGGWWLEHRGPAWTPVPPPGAQWGGPPASDGNPFAPPA